MGERVECTVSGKGDVPQRVLAAMRAGGIIVVEGDGSVLVSGERSVDVMVTFPGAAAKRQTATRGAYLGDLPLGTAAEERRRAQNAEANVAVALDRAKSAEERAEKAEAALAARVKQPSAGDLVRQLQPMCRSLAIAATSGGFRSSPDFVGDLLPLIAAELDKQDAAEKFMTWVQSMPDPGSTVLAEGAGGVASAKDAAASIFEHVFKYAGCAGVEKAFAGIERAAKAASDGSAPPVRHSFDRLWAGAYANALAGGLCRLRLKARQLVRVDAPAAKQPACERVIVAPDGTPITVVHRPAERHYDSSWSTRWAHLDSLVTGPVAASPTPFRPYRHNPTDAEVLADYAAWTERTKR